MQAELVERQRRFIAVFSHELRNPLFCTTANVELLCDEPLSESQRVCVDGIVTSTEQVLDVLNRVLDVAKLETDTFVLQRNDFDVRETLERVVASLYAVAREKQITLCMVMPVSFSERAKKGMARRQ